MKEYVFFGFMLLVAILCVLMVSQADNTIKSLELELAKNKLPKYYTEAYYKCSNQPIKVSDNIVRQCVAYEVVK
jgi:hypothetical protein